MALVTMKALLENARENHRGVGAFNVGNMEMVEGAVAAAEELQMPFIMQIAEGRLKASPLELMGPMMVEAARKAKVDVAVHLDHGKSMDVFHQALGYGFTSVMFDGSTRPFEENIAKTCEVVKLAAQYGATVEAELGLVGGSEGAGRDHGIMYTDPDDVVTFVEHTGVDALAIAIGNAHGNYPVAPHLAFDVLDEIAHRTSTPLVLHGGSGISDADFQKAIRLGIVKVNIATASFNALTRKAEEYIGTEGTHNYFDLSAAEKQGVYENVKHHMEVFGFLKEF